MTILNETHKSIDQDWFGGQVMSVVGECHCSSADKNWDEEENVCAVSLWHIVYIFFLIL